MKTCSRCKQEKPLGEFAKRGKEKYHSHCRPCGRKMSRQHYQKNKSKYIARNNKIKSETRKKYWEYLQTIACSCGENHPAALDFDHLVDKKMSVCKMVHYGYSWASIKKEIAKCQVLCANCHRKKTALEEGWYSEFV